MKKDIRLTSYRISPVSDFRDNMIRHGRVVAHPASDFRLVWVDVREKMPDFIFHQNIVVNNSYVGHFIIASTERRAVLQCGRQGGRPAIQFNSNGAVLQLFNNFRPAFPSLGDSITRRPAFLPFLATCFIPFYTLPTEGQQDFFKSVAACLRGPAAK